MKLLEAPGILVVAPKVGEKGLALKVGEKAASHLSPLCTPLNIYRLVLVISAYTFKLLIAWHLAT